MSWVGVAVGVGGAAAGVAGSAMQANAAGKSPLTFGQKKVSDQMGQLLRQQIYGYYNGQGDLRYGIQGGTPYNGNFLGQTLPQYGQVMGLMNGYNPAQMSTQQQNMWSQAMSGRPSYQAQLDPGTTANYFQQAVANPMMHTFQNQILPQIKEGFAGVGAFSSRQGDAQQRGLSDLQSNLTGQLGQMQLSNQQLQQQMNAQLAESGANRGLNAMNLFGQQQLQFANQPLMAAGAMNSVLSGLQNRQDVAAQMQYQNFFRQAPENSPWLQNMLGYMGMSQKNSVVPPNYINQALSGGSTGLGIWQLLAQQNNKGGGSAAGGGGDF